MVYGSLPSGLLLKSLLSSQYLYHFDSTSRGSYLLANSIFIDIYKFFIKKHCKVTDFLCKFTYFCKEIIEHNE